MIWAHLHNGDFLIHTIIFAVACGAGLVFLNLPVATSWDGIELKGHEFGLLHVRVALTTVLVTEGLALAIGVPLISVGALVVSVVLVERVVQVTVDPRQLGDVAEVERHLSQLAVRLVVVVLPERVQLLVEVAVDNLVAKVPVRLHNALVLDPLGGGRMIEIVHFY